MSAVRLTKLLILGNYLKVFLFDFGFFVAVHFSKQHFLDAALEISIVRKSEAPRFKPGAAG